MLVKKNVILLFALLLITSLAIAFMDRKDEKQLINKAFKTSEIHYRTMLQRSPDLSKYPRTTDKKGDTKYVSISDWTGGFWPGSLWYMYEFTQDSMWKNQATVWTHSLEKNQYNTAHHDLGFMMYCSYGNAYRLTKNEQYKDILVQSAKSLASRFNPVVGCIESWNQRMSWDGKTMWYYPVIIDNLMNLELLFFASKVTGDPYYKDIAIKHADITMKYHIRPDFSTYHVVNYDTATGKVLQRETCQGFADNSTWARGQAWAIYGYTMTYRETGDKKYLELAKNLADFYMNHPNMPKDNVPYWDFNVDQKGFTPLWKYETRKLDYTPRDASAAAIVASALLELNQYLGEAGTPYKEFAVKSIQSLASPEYMAEPSTNGNFLLKHSVGSFPHGAEIDVPIVYADYYFLEALLRLRKG